jgi:hypothetical protein
MHTGTCYACHKSLNDPTTAAVLDPGTGRPGLESAEDTHTARGQALTRADSAAGPVGSRRRPAASSQMGGVT